TAFSPAPPSAIASGFPGWSRRCSRSSCSSAGRETCGSSRTRSSGPWRSLATASRSERRTSHRSSERREPPPARRRGRRAGRRLPHFAELTPELLALVAARARRRTASRDDVLCRAGEPGEEFFLVIRGAVRIAVPTPRGEEVVAELGAGEWFGEMALITGEPR